MFMSESYYNTWQHVVACKASTAFSIIQYNNNNKNFLTYKLIANSPSKLRFEENLPKEDRQSTKHSQKPEGVSDEEDCQSRKGLVEYIPVGFEVSSK